MKKSIWLAAVLLCVICAAGCSKSGESQTEKQTLAVNGSSAFGQTDETEASITGNNDINAETSAPTSAPASAQTEAEAQTQVQTVIQTQAQNADTPASDSNSQNSAGNVTVPPEETQPAEGIFGAEGRTESEWLAAAQQLYKDGCDMAFRYLCTGSEFPFDRANLEIIDKTYFLTTCASFDEATKPYYELFSREYHANDFEGLLLEQNGRLYAARAARGMDMTYLSSEVEKLVSVSDKEIVFSVLVEYEDTTTEMEFSLVPEDGVWKIGRFTLPY